jgi:hypothetical protein
MARRRRRRGRSPTPSSWCAHTHARTHARTHGVRAQGLGGEGRRVLHGTPFLPGEWWKQMLSVMQV